VYPAKFKVKFNKKSDAVFDVVKTVKSKLAFPHAKSSKDISGDFDPATMDYNIKCLELRLLRDDLYEYRLVAERITLEKPFVAESATAQAAAQAVEAAQAAEAAEAAEVAEAVEAADALEAAEAVEAVEAADAAEAVEADGSNVDNCCDGQETVLEGDGEVGNSLDQLLDSVVPTERLFRPNELLRVVQRLVCNHIRCSQTQHIPGRPDVAPYKFDADWDPPFFKKFDGNPNVFERRDFTSAFKNMSVSDRVNTPLCAGVDSGHKTFNTISFTSGLVLYIGTQANHVVGRLLDKLDKAKEQVDKQVAADDNVKTAIAANSTAEDILSKLCPVDTGSQSGSHSGSLMVNQKAKQGAERAARAARSNLADAKKVAMRSRKLRDAVLRWYSIQQAIKTYVESLHLATVHALGDAQVVVYPILKPVAKSSSEFLLYFHTYVLFFIKNKNRAPTTYWYSSMPCFHVAQAECLSMEAWTASRHRQTRVLQYKGVLLLCVRQYWIQDYVFLPKHKVPNHGRT
jgi:hypothetical protein